MSADNRTEQATPRKREKAREKGQVARSRELPAALVILATIFVLSWSARGWIAGWRGLLAGLLDTAARREALQDLARPIAAYLLVTLAPLLGLLGTITGMIASFTVVATAGDIANIGLVAGGISEALITTATGLIIAIPALAGFHLFKVITNVKALRLEQYASEAIEKWFGYVAKA